MKVFLDECLRLLENTAAFVRAVSYFRDKLAGSCSLQRHRFTTVQFLLCNKTARGVRCAAWVTHMSVKSPSCQSCHSFSHPTVPSKS
eukprot:2623317-Pleurochrysis_carterae.AAC.3